MALRSEGTSPLEAWFREHRGWMHRRAAAKLPAGRSDDAVQEAFLKVLRRGSLLDIDNPGAYLSQTLRHEVAGALRQTSIIEVAMPELRDDLLSDDRVETELEAEEDSKILWRCVRLLKDKQRVAIEMKLAGASRAEIGKRLGVSPRAVTMLITRAKINLRRLLISQGYGLLSIPVFSLTLWRSKIRQIANHLKGVRPLETYALPLTFVIASNLLSPVDPSMGGLGDKTGHEGRSDGTQAVLVKHDGSSGNREVIGGSMDGDNLSGKSNVATLEGPDTSIWLNEESTKAILNLRQTNRYWKFWKIHPNFFQNAQAPYPARFLEISFFP